MHYHGYMEDEVLYVDVLYFEWTRHSIELFSMEVNMLSEISLAYFD